MNNKWITKAIDLWTMKFARANVRISSRINGEAEEGSLQREGSIKQTCREKLCGWWEAG